MDHGPRINSLNREPGSLFLVKRKAEQRANPFYQPGHLVSKSKAELGACLCWGALKEAGATDTRWAPSA